MQDVFTSPLFIIYRNVHIITAPCRTPRGTVCLCMYDYMAETPKPVAHNFHWKSGIYIPCKLCTILIEILCSRTLEFISIGLGGLSLSED